MPTLTKVRCGWKWLERTLNQLIEAINENKPIGGAGIHTTVSAGGTSISTQVHAKGSDAATTTGAAGAAASGTGSGSLGSGAFPPDGWGVLAIDIMDANCNRSTIQVLVKTS
jgi:hypothetical protein